MSEGALPGAPSRSRWSSLVAGGLRFAGLQLTTQAIGFLSGLILVRTMAPEEYAYYTLALSLQSAMAILSDSGVSSGFMAIGGRIWSDSPALSRLLRSAVVVRSRFARYAFAIAALVLALTLASHDASPVQIATLTVLVIVGASFQLSASVYSALPRLLLHHEVVLHTDLRLASLRLALVGAAAVFYVDAAVALLVSAIASYAAHILFRKWVMTNASLMTEPDFDYSTRLVAVARSQFLPTLYYCMQAQITIWLITLFGSIRGIAELGALSRFVAVFTLLSAFTSYVLVPRLARAATGRGILGYSSAILLVQLCAAVPLMALAWSFPGALLWLLGPSYAELERELFWMCSNMGIHALAGALWAINAARAWTQGAWLLATVTLAAQAALATMLDLSSLTGVLWLNQLSLIPAMFVNLWMAWSGFRQERLISCKQAAPPAAAQAPE